MLKMLLQLLSHSGQYGNNSTIHRLYCWDQETLAAVSVKPKQVIRTQRVTPFGTKNESFATPLAFQPSALTLADLCSSSHLEVRHGK